MSRGVSYLAAYRLAKSQSTQIAYKQALMEIQNAQAQAQAYADLIKTFDEQILEYNKLKQKLVEQQDPATKNEILQAEIALAQVNERNAGNKVAVYRYADERFDAPSRVDSQIAQLNSDRAANYTGSATTLMNKVAATHGTVFSGLTKEQQQDAAIKLYDVIISEGNAARSTPWTSTDDTYIRTELAKMVGQTSPSYISPVSHQNAKDQYIQGILNQAVGSTQRLRNAIDEAAQAGTVTPNILDQVLVNTAVLAAGDGLDEGDQTLLMSSVASLYQPESQIEFTQDGKKVKVKFGDATDEQKRLYYKENKIPTTIDELFAHRAVMADAGVMRARQAGQIMQPIKDELASLQTRRAAALVQQQEALQQVADMTSPESIRERQAEIFAQTLSPEERNKYLTPEQIKRVEKLEGSATTPMQQQQEKEAKTYDKGVDLTGMDATQINTVRAMSAAVAAQQEGREIELSDLEQDIYAAMSEQIKSGNIDPKDIYTQSQRLGKEMGGLAQSQRNLAQTVASRIYLDMYNDLQATMPDTSKTEQDKIDKDTENALDKDTGF